MGFGAEAGQSRVSAPPHMLKVTFVGPAPHYPDRDTTRQKICGAELFRTSRPEREHRRAKVVAGLGSYRLFLT
jgi:hypothetical protein